jgi:hypothetical protein
MKVYAIFYKYENEIHFQTITTNVNKWLKEHNKQRVNDGNDIERLEEFTIYEDYININN